MMAIVGTRVEAAAALQMSKSAAKLREDEDFLEVADAFIGDNYEERVLRILVTPYYSPLNRVQNLEEFKTVFMDVVKGKRSTHL